MADFDRYASERTYSLPARELQVLRYASHGLTQQDTADAMGVHFETVHTYHERARLELRAKTVAHAVAIALRLGLID